MRRPGPSAHAAYEALVHRLLVADTYGLFPTAPDDLDLIEHLAIAIHTLRRAHVRVGAHAVAWTQLEADEQRRVRGLAAGIFYDLTDEGPGR